MKRIVGGLLIATLAAACRQTPPRDTGARVADAQIEQRDSALTALSRTGWVASASATGSGSPVGNAIDGNAMTRWRGSAAQASGQWFQVDMGSQQTLAAIRLDATATPTEFPRSFRVQVANDNTSWTTAPDVATGTSATAVTTIPFAPQSARFVRVTLTGADAAFWSIHEFNAYNTTLPRTGWAATASVNNTNAALTIDTAAGTRWSTAVGSTNTQVNGQSLTIDMAAPQTFNQITLDTGSSVPTQFPRGVNVTTSNDGMNFGPAIATGAGTGRFTNVNFPTHQARFVRITLALSNPSTVNTPWAVEELNVQGQPLVATTQVRTGWTATASTNSANAGLVLDGNTGTNWTNGSNDTSRFIQVDMGTLRTFTQVTVDSGGVVNNRTYQLQIGNTSTGPFTTVASVAASAATVTISVLPQTSRFIKINQGGTTTNWTVRELNVAGNAVSRSNWVATASPNSGTNIAANALDGSATTRWSTSGAQTNTSFTVDMGTQVVFNQLTLDAGTTPNDFPRNYSVFVSNDGTNFGNAIATGTGSSQVVTINFSTQTARFVKIQTPTTPASGNTWSIQELNVWRIAQPCDSSTCTPSDSCHVAVCDPNVGACVNSNASNGTTCNDGNACTRTDTCQNGTCTGSNPVTCTPSDTCHDAGTCNPTNGTCSNPAKPNGTACNDGNACTRTDSCQAGACTGSNPVMCTPSDTCHDAGTCDPANGTCSNPAKPNGTSCSDGNACTQTDTCQTGACIGANPVMCAPSDPCHDAGTCDPANGTCSNRAKPNGTPCNDGNACTQTDTCQAGVCAGGNPVTCAPQDQCHVSGTCSPTTGKCSASLPAPNGTACSDGNRCSSGDSCRAGTCMPGTTNTCTEAGQTHYVSVIDLGSAQGWSYATGINNSGVVVGADGPLDAGIYQFGTPGTKGFRWSESEGMTYIPWTGSQSYAVDINDNGVMSVSAGQDPWVLTPCRFDPSVDPQPVCDPHAGRAAGINGAGTLTGSTYWPAQATRMLRMGTGPMETLPSAPDPNHDDRANGAAIGPDGSVLGVQMLNGSWTPVRYTDSRGTEFLNNLLPQRSDWTLNSATSIKPGEILGWGTHQGHGRAFRIHTTPAGDLTEIVPLPMPRTYADDAPNIMIAAKSNAANEIVGSVYDGIPFWPQAALVYSDATATIDLNTVIDPQSGWTLLAAFAINDHHEVVGYGVRAGTPGYHAYKLQLPDLSPCATDACHVAVRDPLTGACSSTAKPDGTVCDDGNACTTGDVCTAGMCQGPTAFSCAAPDTCHDNGTCVSASPLPTPPSDDLIGWWKLDGNGKDETAGHHDLANEGAVPTPGRSGMAMRFDGTSCMTAPIWDEARMQGASGLTIMAWVNPDTYTCDTQFDVNTVVGRGWDYSIGSWCYEGVPPGYAQGLAGTVRPAGATMWGYGGGWGMGTRWQLAAVTWDHQNMYTYLDGKLINTWPIPGDVGDIDPFFTVGCMTSLYWSGSDRINNFHGAVDEVMLYRRALSGDEIRSYFTASDPCSHTTLADGTVCNDENLCTTGETCHAGACNSGTAVTCTAPDTCHDPGTCYPWMGCANAPVKRDGAACNDGQQCTQGETCSAGSCQAPANPKPVVTNLPIDYLGTFGPQSFAYDINNAGLSVGWASTPDLSHNDAWRANGPGTITNLAELFGLGSPSSAHAINDSNTIVGFQTTPDGVSHIYRYGQAGYEAIPDLSDGTPVLNEESIVLHAGIYIRGAFPMDINNAGQFVGFYTAGGKLRGFRAGPTGMEDIPPLVPDGSTLMYGVSETGTTVGLGTLAASDWLYSAPMRAVLFDNDVVGLVDLNDLIDPLSGWVLTSATSINGDYIVGSGELNGDGVGRAFRLHRSTGVIDDISGGWYSSGALKVNAAGETVGSGALSAENARIALSSAFVYTDSLGFKNLDDVIPQDFRWSIRGANSINDAGEIVGWGYYWGGWGPSPFHLKVPAGQAATCASRNACGGGDGDAVCLFSDGVVETSPGHFVALFGYDNAAATSVHPTINEAHLDANGDSPTPAPPADLQPGTHSGGYLPLFDSGHTVSWTVGGETVTATATSPHLQPVAIGNNGIGVVIGGQTIVIKADTGPACASASDGTPCDDGNACTRTDVCQAGACVGGNPVDCVASDNCHAAACDPATGQCTQTTGSGACNLGAFDYDKAGRLIRDRGAELHYDAYDQLREVVPTASPPAFTNLPVDDLKTPGEGETQALAGHSNSKGHVPVAVSLVAGGYRTLLFEGNGKPVDLTAAAGMGTSVFGNSMNDADAVAGTWSAGGTNHAFRYDHDGFHDLPNAGDMTIAYDINNQGQITGYFSVNGNAHGYRHSDSTGFQEIGTLGGAQSWGWRVDDLGIVSASAQTPDSPSTGIARFGHAALYQDTVGLQDLNTFVDPPLSGTTLAVANEKQGDWVVGIATQGTQSRAYRLKLSTGAFEEIGWAGSSFAYSVNSAGDAVGWGYTDAGETIQAAWILSERTGFAKLNDLIDPASGWDLRTAGSIDDFGDVVGWGYHNGRVSAYRLRIPAHSSGTGGPIVAEVHTYGYDGLRTSTTTASGTANANTQVWFTQDYSEHDGNREHYVRIGNRIVAKVTLRPPPGGGGGMAALVDPRHPPIDVEELIAKILLALLLAGGLAATGAGLVGKKRRPAWVAITAGPVVLFFLASCDEVNTKRQSAATLWERIETVYFHHGIAAGPVVTTNDDGTLREERRYEPFGQPVNANVGGTIGPVDFRREQQNSLGKLTNPNTGWSYHGARWMQPQTARWTAPDPATLGPDESFLAAPWDLNPYSYAGNTPSVLWDPDGNKGQDNVTFFSVERGGPIPPLQDYNAAGNKAADLAWKNPPRRLDWLGGGTVEGRSVMYREIGSVLASRPGAIHSKWFAAAGIVTTVQGVGGVEAPSILRVFFLSGRATDYLKRVNAELFAYNYRNFQYLKAGKEIPGLEGLRGRDLDYAMVVMEQTLVEKITMRELPDPKVRAKIMAEISDMFSSRFVHPEIKHAAADRGMDTPDFGSLEDRVDLGEGIVDRLYDSPSEMQDCSWCN